MSPLAKDVHAAHVLCLTHQGLRPQQHHTESKLAGMSPNWQADTSLVRCTTECQHMRRRYEDTEHLSVTCGQCVLAPGASTDIVLAFTPREQRAYAEKLRLVILGLSTACRSNADLRQRTLAMVMSSAK